MTAPAKIARGSDLSPALADAVADRTEWRFPSAADAHEVALPWTAPDTVPPALAAEATRVLPAARRAVEPAARETVEKWLLSLGAVVASNMTAADVRVKVRAMATLLDYPAAIYSTETMREAARAFTWFPSYAELAKVLDPIAAALRRRADRLEIIATAPGAEAEAAPACAVWQDARAEIVAALGAAAVSTWIDPLCPESDDGETLTLAVPTTLFADQAEARHGDTLRSILGRRLKFVVRGWASHRLARIDADNAAKGSRPLGAAVADALAAATVGVRKHR